MAGRRPAVRGAGKTALALAAAALAVAVAAAAWPEHAPRGPAAARATIARPPAAGPAAQPPPPSPGATAPPATPGPSPSPAPAPDIAGAWSVTRSWVRACPTCSRPVVRTTTWQIAVQGGDVAVLRGPRGTLRPDGAGGGLLDLDGLETEGDLVLRLRYATLRVAPDGRSLEGAFGGSERGPNPCGDEPPVVTCFASAGWLRAVRIASGPTPSASASPAPTGPATPTAPAPLPTVPLPATASATATATATAATTPIVASPTATGPPTPSPSPAPWPWRRFAPSAWRP